MKIFIKIKYLGSAYSGYQVQKNAPTVQGELCKAAENLFGFECDITGCSRTDSGVHANMFCATIVRHGEKSIKTTLPMERLPRAINAFLPSDIAVYEAEWVDENFHARHDVEYKEYIYKVRCSHERDPFLWDRCWHYPREIDDFALEKMKRAAEHFVGTHDFSAYMAQGSPVENTVRTVFYTDVIRDGENIIFKVAGDGFLYNMVRIMMGTLISVAVGKISPDDIPNITESGDRTRAGMTAPPEGLYLNFVKYR